MIGLDEKNNNENDMYGDVRWYRMESPAQNPVKAQIQS